MGGGVGTGVGTGVGAGVGTGVGLGVGMGVGVTARKLCTLLTTTAAEATTSTAHKHSTAIMIFCFFISIPFHVDRLKDQISRQTVLQNHVIYLI